MGPDFAPCRLLDWDTEFFGRRIATVAPGRLDEQRWAAAREWCRSERIECLTLCAPAADEVTRRVALAAGFRDVDERVTFELALAGEPAAPDARIRSHVAADVPALRAIAARSHTDSRFWKDARFPDDAAGRLYETWIEKSCAGWADRVHVAELDGRPVGYLSCHLREDHGEIGLVAVADAARGLGLGGALVDAGCRWFAESGRATVRVATQGRNEAARRLYESRGFRELSSEVWYHLWLEDPA